VEDTAQRCPLTITSPGETMTVGNQTHTAKTRAKQRSAISSAAHAVERGEDRGQVGGAADDAVIGVHRDVGPRTDRDLGLMGLGRQHQHVVEGQLRLARHGQCGVPAADGQTVLGHRPGVVAAGREQDVGALLGHQATERTAHRPRPDDDVSRHSLPLGSDRARPV
jgi:hypothetical protein